MLKSTYLNSKGNKIELEVSFHAKERLLQRMKVLNPDISISMDDITDYIASVFSQTCRVKNLTSREVERLKRYGADTLLFRKSGLTFIVKNKVIVTVEISDRDKRYLNAKR